jgi:hypothetical protein
MFVIGVHRFEFAQQIEPARLRGPWVGNIRSRARCGGVRRRPATRLQTGPTQLGMCEESGSAMRRPALRVTCFIDPARATLQVGHLGSVSVTATISRQRGSHYAELSRQIRAAGLLGRARGHYWLRIAATMSLFAICWWVSSRLAIRGGRW